MKDLSRRLGIAVVIITHNLGIVARYADRVNVMYAARLVESGTAERCSARRCIPMRAACSAPCRGSIAAAAPSSPPSTARRRICWTRRRAAGFARAAASRSTNACEVPPLEAAEPRPSRRPAIAWQEIEALDPRLARGGDGSRRLRASRRRHADPRHSRTPASSSPCAAASCAARAGARRQRRDASISSAARRWAWSANPAAASPPSAAWCCGWTTRPPARSVSTDVDLARLTRSEMVAVRKKMQVIFQDPYSSLNPRMTVGQIIAEPMRVHAILPKDKIPHARGRAAAAGGALPLHGAALSARAVGRAAPARRHRPGARGRAARHRLRRGGLGARRVDPGPGHQPARGPAAEARPHLPVHRPRSRRGAAHLDQGGRDVSGAHRRVRAADELFANPKHPYTKALLAAAPIPDPVIERTRPRTIIKGELPSPLNPPSGCVFHPRCPLATEECQQAVPAVRELGSGASGGAAFMHKSECVHSRMSNKRERNDETN